MIEVMVVHLAGDGDLLINGCKPKDGMMLTPDKAGHTLMQAVRILITDGETLTLAEEPTKD